MKSCIIVLGAYILCFILEIGIYALILWLTTAPSNQVAPAIIAPATPRNSESKEPQKPQEPPESTPTASISLCAPEASESTLAPSEPSEGLIEPSIKMKSAVPCRQQRFYERHQGQGGVHFKFYLTSSNHVV